MKKFIKIGTKVVTRHGEAKVTGIEPVSYTHLTLPTNTVV